MKLRPHGWPLPRPQALHHMIEDFLTEWDGPISHVQPLRRFLEHCVQSDLRTFYAGKAAYSYLIGFLPPKNNELRKSSKLLVQQMFPCFTVSHATNHFQHSIFILSQFFTKLHYIHHDA